jgi:hypothetical protein
VELPKFVWLRIEGIPGQDDFGIGKAPRLVISERALEALRGPGISNALAWISTEDKSANMGGMKD